MKKLIISRILSIISIIVLVMLSIITIKITIELLHWPTPIEGDDSIFDEGAGLAAMFWIFINAISIGVSFIFNLVAYILLPNIKNEKGRRKNLMPLIIILLSGLVFIGELFAFRCDS